MSYVRFYEKNPTVRQAVTTLFGFPDEIRSILAKGMCAIAETDFNAHIRIRDLKSLGKEKVLALYKAQQKRRDYDKDPYLSRAMNYLMILEPSDQFFLAVKVNDMIQVVGEFVDLCKRHAQKVQLAIVERITGIYVHCGLNEAEELLSTIHGRFERYFPILKPSDPPAQPAQGEAEQEKAAQSAESDKAGSGHFWATINDEGSGMTLRLEH